MTFQPGANLYTQGFGSRPENVEIPHIDVRAPATTDIMYPQGKFWVDQVHNATYELTSFSTVGNITTANWEISAGSNFLVQSLSGDTGTATPTLGNIKLAGTADEITTAASGSTVTFTIPTTFIAPGSIASTTTLTGGTGITATTGNIVATAGNISTTAGSISSATTVTAGTGVTATTGNLVATAGNLDLNGATSKININAGTPTTASAGKSTLSTGGTVVVSTSAVTTSSLIFLSYNNCTSTNPAALDAPTGSIIGSTSFVIKSQDTSDTTSTVNWWIIN